MEVVMDRQNKIDYFSRVLSNYSNNIFICKKDIKKALNLTCLEVDAITQNLDYMGTRTHLYLKTEIAESIVDYMSFNKRNNESKINISS